MANDFLKKMGQQPLFETHLAGTRKIERRSKGILSITPDVTIKEVRNTDLIIIPAIHGNYRDVVSANSEFIPWIK